MKKLDALALAIALLFMAVAFAGGASKSDSGERVRCVPEFAGNVMDKSYQVPPSNQGE